MSWGGRIALPFLTLQFQSRLAEEGMYSLASSAVFHGQRTNAEKEASLES